MCESEVGICWHDFATINPRIPGIKGGASSSRRTSLGLCMTLQDLDLVEFSVVLVAQQSNPSIINQDFLKHSGIVDKNLSAREPLITTPVFSQVTFEDGSTVKADPERTIFEQVGDPLAQTNIRCPEMAKHFVKLFPNLQYQAVGINPKGFKAFPNNSPAQISVSDSLLDKGEWLSFKDTKPEFQLKAIYRFEKRTITLDLVETQRQDDHDGTTRKIMFQANFHRDLQGVDQQTKRRQLSSILSSWEKDLSDFSALIGKFDPRRFMS